MPLHPLELELADFLALAWSDPVRAKLKKVAWEPETNFLLAIQRDDRLTATMFTQLPRQLPAGVVAIWRKDPLQDAVKSKTQQAVDLVLKDGMTPHAAAALMKVHSSAVYRALQRAQEKPLCPCCGQVVREGFTVDRSLLKTPSGGRGAA